MTFFLKVLRTRGGMLAWSLIVFLAGYAAANHTATKAAERLERPTFWRSV